MTPEAPAETRAPWLQFQAPKLVARAVAIISDRQHREHLLTVLLQLLSLGLSMATFRLAASWFGAVGFGEYALARRALSVVTFPLLLGLGTSLPRFATQHRPGFGSGDGASYLLAALLIAAPVLLVTTVVIGVFPGPFAGLVFGDVGFTSLSRPTLAAVVGLYLHMLVFSFLVGQFRTGAASLLQLINVAAAPGLAVVVSGGDVACALLCLGAISATTSIVSAVEVAKGLDLRAAAHQPLTPRIWDLLCFGIPRVPGELALFGMFALPTFVAAKRLGIEEAGLLSFGLSLIQLIGSFFAAGAVLLLPQTGRMLAEGRSDRVVVMVAWVLGLAVAGAIAMVAVVEATLGPLIGLLVGPRLAEGASSSRLLLLGAVPYVAYIVLRGPLDAVSRRPHGSINLGIALGVEISWLAAGGIPALGVPISLTILGLLMVVSWSRAFKSRTSQNTEVNLCYDS